MAYTLNFGGDDHTATLAAVLNALTPGIALSLSHVLDSGAIDTPTEYLTTGLDRGGDHLAVILQPAVWPTTPLGSDAVPVGPPVRVALDSVAEVEIY